MAWWGNSGGDPLQSCDPWAPSGVHRSGGKASPAEGGGTKPTPHLPIDAACLLVSAVADGLSAAPRHTAAAGIAAALRTVWELSGTGKSVGDPYVDDQVRQRLQALDPPIRAQVIAKTQGRASPSSRQLVESDVHVVSNAAKHNFKRDFPVTPCQARVDQRAATRSNAPRGSGEQPRHKCTETKATVAERKSVSTVGTSTDVLAQRHIGTGTSRPLRRSTSSQTSPARVGAVEVRDQDSGCDYDPAFDQPHVERRGRARALAAIESTLGSRAIAAIQGCETRLLVKTANALGKELGNV